MKNLKKYTTDLKKLTDNGVRLQLGFLKELNKLDSLEDKDTVLKEHKPLNFKQNYEYWYSESLAVIQQLMPNRLEDFVKLYKNDKRKDIDYLTYTISDYLLGITTRLRGEIIADGSAAYPKFQQQFNILASVAGKFKSSLFEIKQLVQADFFDCEISSAKELNTKGFYRASGVICGVIIEKHLKQVCENHEVKMTKKNPTISDFNDLLKSKEVIEISVWRFIQRLADIRNLSGHNKEREPTKDEIMELIDGTDKLIKTLF